MARTLDVAECYALLRERGWGILSMTDATNATPYAVPVAFALNGDAICIAVGPADCHCRPQPWCVSYRHECFASTWSSRPAVPTARTTREAEHDT